MQRRTFLELLAGLALTGTSSAQSLTPRRVVVAGGGIVGASIALQLSRRGAAVTVVEKTAPASGATANSFAWINAKKRPLDYFNLSRLGIYAWHQVDRELNGRLPLTWGGAVEWRREAGQATSLAEQLRVFQEWSYVTYAIDEQRLRLLEPHAVLGQVAGAALWEDEGQVDPVRATEVLLAAAAESGARLEHPCEVTGVDAQSGRLRAVRTTRGDIEADVLVVACGADTARVAGLAGITVPLRDAPGTLAHTSPLPRLVQRVVLSPAGHIKQKPDGRIVMYDGDGGVQQTREAGQRVIDQLATVFPALAKAPLDKVTLGYRPMPRDGRPIVGFPDGRRDVYLAVMHSGVTLSPLMGRLAATEILDQARVDVLAQYRLERFDARASGA